MAGPPIPTEESPRPRYLVTPTIAGVPTAEIECDGDLTTATDQPPLYWRIVVNPGDNSTAAASLRSGYPEVVLLQPGGNPPGIGPTNVAITDVYAIAVGAGAIPADYAGGAYIISKDETDNADALAQMAHWVFAAADDVRELIFSCSAVFNTHYMRLSCVGVSYA